MIKSTKTLAALCVSAVALTGVSATGFAQEVITKSQIVDVEQNELLSEAGIADVRDRIANAARQVCSDSYTGRRTLSELRAQRECMELAVAGAETQLEQRVAEATGGAFRLALAKPE